MTDSKYFSTQRKGKFDVLLHYIQVVMIKANTLISNLPIRKERANERLNR